MTGWDASREVATLMHPPPRHMLLDPQFRKGFAELAPLGLSFDALCYHPATAGIDRSGRLFPRHAGHRQSSWRPGPGRALTSRTPTRSRAAGRKTSAALGKRPNTFMKVGAMTMRAFDSTSPTAILPPTSAELAEAWKPFVEICIEAFGPDRVMFESNFPVDKTGTSVPRAVERVQTDRRGLFAQREGGSVCRHGDPGLSLPRGTGPPAGCVTAFRPDQAGKEKTLGDARARAKCSCDRPRRWTAGAASLQPLHPGRPAPALPENRLAGVFPI